MTDIGFRDVRNQLQTRALELCRHLLPEGRRNGNYWICRNPTRDDRSAGSFYVWINGAAAGGFRDDAAGDKGDVIDLIAYVSGYDRKAAFDWAKRWLGIDNARPEEIRRRNAIAQKQARQQDIADAAALERNRASAKAMWLNARKWQTGDPVDLYLRGRGIVLDRKVVAANAIRFAPEMKHLESGKVFACMIVAMSDASGTIAAVHRTWLAMDAAGQWGKAPVSPARKIWPSFAGCVLRLNKGGKNLSPEEAEKRNVREPCVIVEGVEDGLAVAISRPDLRVWAAGSLGNLGNVPRLPCVSEFIVCKDNDWGKPQAEKQFDQAVKSLAETGVKVSVARSWIGKDVNDLLKGTTNV